MNTVFHTLQILHLLHTNYCKIENCYDCVYFMVFQLILPQPRSTITAKKGKHDKKSNTCQTKNRKSYFSVLQITKKQKKVGFNLFTVVQMLWLWETHLHVHFKNINITVKRINSIFWLSIIPKNRIFCFLSNTCTKKQKRKQLNHKTKYNL